MATSGLVVEHIAARVGIRPATVLRMVRPLRDVGLVAAGTIGGNQKQGHFSSKHLANLLLAFGGYLPSDASDAALLLGGLKPLHLAPQNDGAETLHDLITREIEKVGDWLRLQQLGGKEANEQPQVPTLITLSLMPLPWAWVTWQSPNGSEVTIEYGPDGLSQYGVVLRSKTELGFELIYAAGWLWADTMSRTGELPLSVSTTVFRRDDGNSAPEHEKTSGPGRSEASTRAQSRNGALAHGSQTEHPSAVPETRAC